MKIKCLLLNHNYDLKNDEKTIYCKRCKYVEGLYKKDSSFIALSIARTRRRNFTMDVVIGAFLIWLGIELILNLRG